MVGSVVCWQVMESEEFMLLPANQLIDIISSDELNVRSEEQVFNAVMAWVKYSIQERRLQLPQVCLTCSGCLSELSTFAFDTDLLCHYRFFNMSDCPCSAPSSWLALWVQILSSRVTRSAGEHGFTSGFLTH